MIAAHSNQRREALLLLVPAFVLLTLFVIWPLGRAVIWGFTDARLMTPQDATWKGFSNYSSLLSDSRFQQAFKNTALFALAVVPIQTLLAFSLALLVNRPAAHWRWLRIAFFLPVVLSLPVLAVLWSMIYQPAQGSEMGLLNRAVGVIGILPQSWLRDPHLALGSLAFMSIWQGVGLQMMVFLAGLQHVPRELMEAAELDGAGPWDRLWNIIIPSLRNTILFVLTVTTILAFRLFVQPYIMTRGGPGNRTLSIVQYIYETTFKDDQLGRACAAAILFLLLVGALTGLQRIFSREVRE